MDGLMDGRTDGQSDRWTKWRLYALPLRSIKIHIAFDKMIFFFNPKVLILFLFVHKNISCRYSLEAPPQVTSNEYLRFHGEIR